MSDAHTAIRNRLAEAAGFAKGLAVAKAERDSARADLAEALEALRPFAEFERVRKAMGGLSQKSGVLQAVHSSAGSAELSVEDYDRARAILSKHATPEGGAT